MKKTGNEDIQKLLSSLPSVDSILKSKEANKWLEDFPRQIVIKSIRETIDSIRGAIIKDNAINLSNNSILDRVYERIRAFTDYSLKPVVNATGIVIHTNLGRSVLSEDIMNHVKEVSCGYSTLEYDLSKGARGKRYSHVQKLLREITGAEDALIVNNNAAAVFVSLREIAKGREVIVSRGELVEIGGSFRVPDVMAESGAILKEVGTTNKTHLHDYERAINPNTALLLKVHQSNFRTIGFTKLVEIDELSDLGRKYKIPVMFDLGSGCLIDLKPYGIFIEPSVQDIIKSGCDIVTFSGDKLLGGPQGGVIAGKKNIIERISKNPLMRAVRVDKMTLSAFESVLLKYLDLEKAKTEIPTLNMILQELNVIKQRATVIHNLLLNRVDTDSFDASILEDESQAGGGSLPELNFKTFVVAIKPKKITVSNLENRLRKCTVPIIARVKDDMLIIDVRTVQDREIETLVDMIKTALG
ncbi:MAG: L-seryl-tRNA(Sec) selenium transferase [Thermodesulfovibrionales bacterium]|nr:L-seryl-tRNA(Sec) selenium transferase [Thermodesulfovibrionales bacterium]